MNYSNIERALNIIGKLVSLPKTAEESRKISFVISQIKSRLHTEFINAQRQKRKPDDDCTDDIVNGIAEKIVQEKDGERILHIQEIIENFSEYYFNLLKSGHAPIKEEETLSNRNNNEIRELRDKYIYFSNAIEICDNDTEKLKCLRFAKYAKDNTERIADILSKNKTYDIADDVKNAFEECPVPEKCYDFIMIFFKNLISKTKEKRNILPKIIVSKGVKDMFKRAIDTAKGDKEIMKKCYTFTIWTYYFTEDLEVDWNMSECKVYAEDKLKSLNLEGRYVAMLLDFFKAYLRGNANKN